MWDHKCLIWVFLGKNFKKLLSYLKSASLNMWKTQKYLNLGPKMPYLGILGKNFKKTIFRFEISTLKFVYLQNFTEKQKCLNSGPKMPDLGIFLVEFENNIVIFEISTNFPNCKSL